MNKYRQDLEEILYWLKKKGPDFVCEAFFHPCADIFPSTDRIFETASSILDLVSIRHRNLFSTFCLAGLALNFEQEALRIIKELPQELFAVCPEPDRQGLVHGKWTRVPLLLADNHGGELRWILLSLGAYPRFPGRTTQLISGESLEAVIDAAVLAGVEQHFCFWPVMDDIQDRHLIQGRSLALPVFLGLKSLQNQDVQEQAAATGDIDITGRVKTVSFLGHKAEVCKKFGFKAIVCPRQAITDFPGIEYIMVSDIKQAGAAWKRYVPGCDFGAYLTLCSSHDTCREMLVNMPDAVLRQLADTGMLSHLTRDILNDHQLLERYVKSLKSEIQRPDWDGSKVSILLDEISPGMLTEIKDIDPWLAHELATLQKTKCNHLGRLKEGNKWSAVINLNSGNVLMDTMAEYKPIDDFNLDIIHLHNRYTFRPDLDIWGSEAGQRLQSGLDSFYNKEKLAGCAVNSSLGALYGTLAQNYGFCGPGYLSRTIECSRMAMRFFGNGKILGKYRQDYLRQHAYLFYAFLEAEKENDALKNLKIYLDVEDLNGFDFNDANPYKHACLMRFLADRPELLPEYTAWGESIVFKVPNQHPWQLWLKNLAMAAHKNEIKTYCLQKSVDICLKHMNTQETLVPMALHGIFLQWVYKLESTALLVNRISQIQSFIRSSSLSPDHFCFVVQNRFNHPSLLTSELIKSLFPFSYR